MSPIFYVKRLEDVLDMLTSLTAWNITTILCRIEVGRLHIHYTFTAYERKSEKHNQKVKNPKVYISKRILINEFGFGLPGWCLNSSLVSKTKVSHRSSLAALFDVSVSPPSAMDPQQSCSRRKCQLKNWWWWGVISIANYSVIGVNCTKLELIDSVNLIWYSKRIVSYFVGIDTVSCIRSHANYRWSTPERVPTCCFWIRHAGTSCTRVCKG